MKSATNFKSSPASNTVSLTELMVRCHANAERAPSPAEQLPVATVARPIALDYPHINSQPEYAAEAAKLNRFTAQRDQAIETLEALKVEFGRTFKADEKTEESAISKAETLLAGEAPRNLQADMHETARLIDALGAAILAQHEVVRRVNVELSRAAGRRYADEHKARVKRLMGAVIELDAANRAEGELQADLIRLGYIGSTLPGMRLHSAEDPFDTNGNIAYYWYKEAANYVKTDEELAAGVRKARLAAAVG